MIPEPKCKDSRFLHILSPSNLTNLAVFSSPSFTDTFIKELILIIVLPVTLAVFFVVVICLRFRPTLKEVAQKDEVRDY